MRMLFLQRNETENDLIKAEREEISIGEIDKKVIEVLRKNNKQITDRVKEKVALDNGSPHPLKP